MTKQTLALVVVGFDRPDALQRLLGSLLRLRVVESCDLPLVVSLDDNRPAVRKVADEFEWPHGDKRIIGRSPRMGLRKHVLACGELALEYGAVAVLEDDLYVSPDMLQYALGAMSFYKDTTEVAGISLYSYRVSEESGLPFFPLDDGRDTFFLQMPASSGQVWTAAHWRRFRDWYDRAAQQGVSKAHDVPTHVTQWPETSWKKYFLRYLVETGSYFAYPRSALSTNCGDAGTHYPARSPNPVTTLSRGRTRWHFSPFQGDAVCYDAWFEPTAGTLRNRWPVRLLQGDLTVDLLGFKTDVKTELLLSSRTCHRPIHSFPLTLLPLPENLQLLTSVGFFHLGRTNDFGPMTWQARRDLFEQLCSESVPWRTAAAVIRARVSQRLRALLDRLMRSA